MSITDFFKSTRAKTVPTEESEDAGHEIFEPRPVRKILSWNCNGLVPRIQVENAFQSFGKFVQTHEPVSHMALCIRGWGTLDVMQNN